MFSLLSFVRHKKTPGFSLLEIVVAISLLAITLVAIFSVVNKILQVSTVTENDFIAKGLLTEGGALAEAIRNNNVSSSLPFYTSLMTTPLADGKTYTMRIDYKGSTTSVTGISDSNAQLKYDSTNFYQYTSGTAVPFYRILYNTYHVSANRKWLEVQCQVYWSYHGQGSTQKLTTMLYNTGP
jgi:prepilin-type N-terminal cleavage/methylation domain-containing protein